MDPDGGRSGRRPAHAVVLPVHLYGQTGGHARSRTLAMRHGTSSSSRTPARRTARAATAARAGADGPRRSVQLLSGQEPRRDGGRRRARHGRRRARRRACARSASTARREKYRHADVGLHRPPRHDPGARAPAQASAPRRVERAAPGGRALLHEALEGVGDLRLPHVPSGSDPVWHLFVVRTADPDGLADHPRASAASATGRHYPEPPHLSDAYAASRLRAGRVPRRRAARAGKASRSRSSPASPRRRSDASSRRSAPTSTGG